MSTPIVIVLVFLLGFGSSSQTFFDFQVVDIKGNAVDLADFKGRVTLVVNTASQCSLTDSHMKSLKRLHDILSFSDQFNVLAFPSNDFGEQEPWDEPEVEEYVRGHFKAEFPLMGKTKVVGSDASPVWKWIGESSVAPSWNFHKYLVNREGKIVKQWGSQTTVESIFTDIQSEVDGDVAVRNDTSSRGSSPSPSEDVEKGEQREEL